MLRILLAFEEKVRGFAEDVMRQIPEAVPDTKKQKRILGLLLGLLIQKLTRVNREEVIKMVAPLLSDIRE